MKHEKISVAMLTNDMNINGISTVVMNYCKYLNKEKFNITIIAGRPINELYIEECKKYGITLMEMPERREKPTRFYMCLFKCFIANKYDIVHVHGNSAMITPELGIVFIEAQINGLPVVTSDQVPREVNIGEMTKFLSLNEIADKWAGEILKVKYIDRDAFYEEHRNKIDLYNIKNNVKELENCYKSMMEIR